VIPDQSESPCDPRFTFQVKEKEASILTQKAGAAIERRLRAEMKLSRNLTSFSGPTRIIIDDH
jgi:hypothetical protein